MFFKHPDQLEVLYLFIVGIVLKSDERHAIARPLKLLTIYDNMVKVCFLMHIIGQIYQDNGLGPN